MLSDGPSVRRVDLFGLEVADKQSSAVDGHVGINDCKTKTIFDKLIVACPFSPFRHSLHHVQVHSLRCPRPGCLCSCCRLLQGSWRCVIYCLILQINDVFRSVHKSASDKDIRHAYKKLSKKYHPDKNKDPGAEERFVEIAHGKRGCRYSGSPVL